MTLHDEAPARPRSRLAGKLQRTSEIRRFMTLDLMEFDDGEPVDLDVLQENLARRAKAAWPRVTLKDLRAHAAHVLRRLATFQPPDGAGEEDADFRRSLLDTWIRRCAGQARSRAAKAGLPCDVTPDVVRGLYERQQGRCRLSGIAFSAYPYFLHTKVKRPFAPSLNRLDARGGYTEGNVELVCTMANFAMNGWDYQTLLSFCRGVVRTAGRRRSRRPGLTRAPGWMVRGGQ